MLLIALFLTPFIAAIASVAVGNKKVLDQVAIVAAAVELLLTAGIIQHVVQDKVYFSSTYFVVDSLGALIMLLTAVVGLAALVYTSAYLGAEMEEGVLSLPRVREFYGLLHIFFLAMFMASAARHLILLWILIEATTLSMVFLISFYRTPIATEAAWKYLLINSIGLLFSFLGTMLFAAVATNWAFATTGLPFNLGVVSDPGLIRIAFALILVGYGTKMGLVPMHTWLPDAHSEAPSVVSALLSSIMPPLALLAIMRFKVLTDSVLDPTFTRELLVFFGSLTVLLAAVLILRQRRYKRLLAYSTIEHSGLIALGLGFGGAATFIALLHMVYHTLAKASLFFTAGSVLLKYGHHSIAKIRGLFVAIPLTGVLLLVGAAAILGLPPFGLFVTELGMMAKGFVQHPWVVSMVAILLALAFVGFARHLTNMVFGPVPDDLPKHKIPLGMSIPSVCLLLILVVVSWYVPGWLSVLLHGAAGF